MEANFLYNFFISLNMGFTYGYAQMSPLRMLTVNRLVPASVRVNTNSQDALISIFSTLVSPSDANFFNPDIVYYVAATIKSSINAYAKIAHYDISNHPEITTTLYKTGHEKSKASKLKSKNSKALQSGEKAVYPMPDDMGKWVLQNQDAIARAIQ